jgi:hypothetical protein
MVGNGHIRRATSGRSARVTSRPRRRVVGKGHISTRLLQADRFEVALPAIGQMHL